MKRILYLAWGLFFAATLNAQTPCNSESFLKTFTNSNTVGIGLTLCASGDGNLYASGLEDNRTTLMKLTTDGDIIWSRSFSVDALLPCAINEMIVDSDGILVAAGIQTTLQQGNPQSLVFRYNPNTNTVLWSKTLAADSITVDGVIEKNPGGNYVFYQTSFEPFTNGVRADILELDRLTGTVVPGLAKRYTLNTIAGLARVVSYQGALYAVGTAQSLPTAVPSFRTLLMRLDIATGQPVWSNLSYGDNSTAEDYVGVDLLADNGALMTLSSSAVVNGATNNPISIFLQKNDLDGNILWMKKYDSPALSNLAGAEIVKLSTGYAIYGAGAADLAVSQVLLLVDNDGNIITTKGLDGFDQSATLALRGEAIVIDDHLFAAGTSIADNDVDWLLLKTDANLTLNTVCDYLQTLAPTQVEAIADPTSVAVSLQVTVSSTPAVNRPITLVNKTMVSQLVCSGCQTNCSEFREVTVLLTAGGSVVINGVTYTSPTTVTVTEPSTTGCDVITTYTIQLSNTVPPGTCDAQSFVRTFSNNSTTGVGLTVCASGDGNLYASGMESNKTTLLKVTPNGTVIWSRSFEVGATAAFAISEMIVDSDGILVAAGIQAGTQQTNPSSLVFRYNPATNTVLWSKSFVADSVVVDGIIEKNPGGNYIFYQTSFQPFTAGVQAEILEIDRFTGNLVPSLARRYTLNNATGLARVVSYQGALYAIGTAQTLPTAVPSFRTLLMRLNANTGQPVWSNVSYGAGNTAEDFIGADMLVDNDAIYALSSSTYIDLSASTPVSIYLHKHDLNGNVLWMKKYESPAFSNVLGAEIVKLGDGYAIYGAGITGLSLNQLLILIDGDGNVVSTSGVGGFSQSAPLALRGEIVVLDDHLYLAGTSADGSNSIDTDWSLLKTDAQFTPDDCGYLRTLAATQMESISNPTTVAVSLQVTASSTPAVNQSVAFANTSLASQLLCYECEFNGVLTLTCPANISPITNAGETTTVVDYDLPTATTTCPVGNAITITLLSGLPIGGAFPVGVTTVCYLAQDQCGNTATCCFQITVTAGENSCDVKTNGCFRWELLPFKLNALGERRYRIKVTNSCALDLDHVLFQVPNGITAEAPADGSIYTDAISGRTYIVRNPNFSPYYSVRFKTNVGVVMNGGVSDILEYTLPQQSQPQYIQTTAKFKNGTTVSAFLNTFGCPVLPFPLAPNPGNELRVAKASNQYLSLYPNPTSGNLMVDLAAWDQQSVKIDVLNAQGQLVQTFKMEATVGLQDINLNGNLPNGLYQLVVRPNEGIPVTEPFMIQRD